MVFSKVIRDVYVDNIRYSNLVPNKVYTFKDFSKFYNPDNEFCRFDITYGKGITSVPITGLYIADSVAATSQFNNSFIAQVDVSKLDTSAVTDMSGMFAGCRFVKHLDLSTFNTAKVNNMRCMFNGCESLEYLDLRSFNFTGVRSPYGMFSNCKSLKVIYPNGLYNAVFNFMDQLDNPSYMFYNCESLEYINLSFASIPQKASLSSMFEGCKSLPQIDVFSQANGDYKPADMIATYKDCSSLTNLSLVTIHTTYIFTAGLSGMLKGCTSLGDITFGEGWGEGTEVLVLDLCDCNSSGNYVLSANTWNSMLTMYDRKTAGGNLFIIRLNSKHIPNSGSNVPENWKENMAARGYTISEVEA